MWIDFQPLFQNCFVELITALDVGLGYVLESMTVMSMLPMALQGVDSGAGISWYNQVGVIRRTVAGALLNVAVGMRPE